MAKTQSIVPAQQVTMPVEYDRAVKALKQCRNINESKRFVDAAEALAVWAKIYNEDEASAQAKRLRLHAYRRMGELAIEVSPGGNIPGGGRKPGPVAELKKHGLSRHAADAAHLLGKMPKDEFAILAGQEAPPAPTSVARRFREPGSMGFYDLLRERPKTPFACAVFIAKNDPEAIAAQLDDDERRMAVRSADMVIRWLQAFVRASTIRGGS